MNKSATIYQFLVLVAIIVFNGYFIIIQGEPNEILLGALIGVMIGLPSKEEPKLTQPKETDTIELQ